MLVAISQRSDKNKHGDLVDNLENNYIAYLEKLGVKLLIIPNSTNNIDFYFEKFPVEGVLLSGGNSINPTSYGGEGKDRLSIAENRDKIEKKMLEIAIKRNMPVLGICRGLQFINVFFGGKLEDVYNHTVESHKIKTGKGDFCVNSYHNQGITVRSLSSKLKSFAEAFDGIIEGIYHPDLPIVGIQWHPERKSPDEAFNKELIEAFLRRKSFWQ